MRVWAVLLIMVLAGCTSNGFDPTTKFPYADQRFSGSMSEAGTDVHQATFLQGLTTIGLSIIAPDGFDLGIYNKGASQRLDGLGMEDTKTKVNEVTWLSFSSSSLGEKELRLECGGPCRYTVAIEHPEKLPDPVAIEGRYRGWDSRASGELDSDFYSKDFSIRNGTRTLTIAFSGHSSDWLRWTLTAASGEKGGQFGFPAVTAHDFSYTLDGDAFDEGRIPGGTWNLLVNCDGECVFAHGFEAG